MVVSDSCPFLFQSKIIANMQGCTSLAVFDTGSFFYQWLLNPDHRFIFTVVTDRGQKTFQVLIMGYINSIAHFQLWIDKFLRAVDTLARDYIHDIVCRVTLVADLFKKFHVLFEIFVAHNISIKPTKTYLNYLDVSLLGQQVKCLGLTTCDDKLRII